MGCKDTLWPDTILKNLSVNCLAYKENTRKPYNDSLCLLIAPAWLLQRNERLESEASKKFNLFLEKTGGTDPANFRGIRIKGIALVEDIVQADFFLYDIDIVNGSMIGDLARMSVRRDSNTVRLLRSSSYICHVSITNAPFKVYSCPS